MLHSLRSVFLRAAVIIVAMAEYACVNAYAQPAAPPTRIAILGALQPLTNNEDAAALASDLKRHGHDVSILSAVQLTDVNSFNATIYPLLIVPHCDVFPAEDLTNLRAFLKAKGRLLCLGGPALTRLVYSAGRTWMTRQELFDRQPVHVMKSVADAEPEAWVRSSFNPAGRASITKEGGALHLIFNAYQKWDNFALAFHSSPFLPGDTLTSFEAKGDPTTHAIVVEWDEADGSRWIAAAPLTAEWRKVTLQPADFHYWPDNTAPGRGKAGDHLNTTAVAKLSIGLADSHAPTTPGPHELWIKEIGGAALPPGYTTLKEPLTLEGLTPMYKQVHDAVSDMWLPILRDRGIGLSDSRMVRLMPADLSPVAYPTQNAAYASWLSLALAGPFKYSLWGGLANVRSTPRGISPDPQPLIARMLQNVYFSCAGAELPCYTTGAPMRIGANAINIGPRAAALWVEQRLYPVEGNAAGPISVAGSVNILPGESVHIDLAGAEKAPASGEWRYSAYAYAGKGGPLLDRIEMPIRVIPAELQRADDSGLPHAANGEFIVQGKPFRPVGVNFWPLYVSGRDAAPYQHGWLSPEQYDADLVEQDLVRCEHMNINLASVQYLRADQAPALEDFMARCRNHHILVNVFVAAGDPRDLRIGELNKMLDAARLDHNPDLFAFDVAWEPHLGRHAERVRFDVIWARWIALNYGSVENAEADWGVPAPRGTDGISNPTDEQIASDGPWRRMTAAYRRFVDEMLSQGYRRVTQALHVRGAMVGARSGYGGNGEPGVDAEFPFDLLSGAAHLDFVSPEGYALSGDWDQFREGGFTAAYARWAGDGKPVFWAEFGKSVYPNADAARLLAQADLYDKMYRLVLDSGSNGSAFWWLPGGLRVDENSDFGILEPDGAERPAAAMVRRQAQQLPLSTVSPAATAEVTGDRDADSRGFTALNARLKQEYGRERAAGKVPAYRTAGTGSTTANMPLMAVGNSPANGSNPLKYACAEIYADPAKPQTLVLLNTGEATWTHAGAGRVALLVYNRNSNTPVSVPLTADVPRYGVELVDMASLQTRVQGGVGLRYRLAVLDRADAPRGVSLFPFGEEFTDNGR